MNLEKIWHQFSPRQYSYLGDIVGNSSAKSVCEIGAFCGGVARAVWQGIKDTDKELYLIDNYAFLPERFRKHFFKAVKKTISNSDRIHMLLENSHEYDWTKHDFLIFSHADFDHMEKDFDRLLDSKVKWVALDLPKGCFKRTAKMLDAITNKKLFPSYYVDGMIICGPTTPCTLPTQEGTFLGHQVRYVEKKKGSYNKAVEDIVKNL